MPETRSQRCILLVSEHRWLPTHPSLAVVQRVCQLCPGQQSSVTKMGMAYLVGKGVPVCLLEQLVLADRQRLRFPLLAGCSAQPRRMLR